MRKLETEQLSDVELRPDGQKRFIEAVHALAKSTPKHREAAKPATRSRVVKDTEKA